HSCCTDNLAAHSVCSPPPLWGGVGGGGWGWGLGVGVAVAGPSRVKQLRPRPRRFAPPRVLTQFHLFYFSSPFPTAHLVPGARFCAGFLIFGFAHPHEGVAERRETYGCLRGIRWACTIGAGQAPSEAPCAPMRGTPASRRSHRG